MLRTTGEGAFELIKKRYNVAASRARDQLWVVHSFDPDHHLRPNDIRLKLFQHVRDPLAYLRANEQEVGKTESPFERDVLKRLTDAGFRVRSQWPVGYYRIDMVVEGAGKRLAIECDGDRYHPMEKLAEDMARQAVLERLGWQFVRIRGSAFYRNGETAMRPVFDRLAELEIPPEVDADVQATEGTEMTLIHELDALMRDGLQADEAQVDALQVPSESILEEQPAPELDDLAPLPPDLSFAQVETLLRGLNGTALLDPFLRDLARARGSQRLGRKVRAGLEAELEMLARQGKVAIGGGYIRLL
jgi:very-short-patch-repair endonuclease